MSLTNGKLRVPQDGRYYLYSQVSTVNEMVVTAGRFFTVSVMGGNTAVSTGGKTCNTLRLADRWQHWP